MTRQPERPDTKALEDQEVEPTSPPEVDPVALFEDYLALRAEERSPDTRVFLARAGGRAPELMDLLATLQELEDIPDDPTDPSFLLEEYLVAKDAGESPDLAELVERAGDRADELRELLRTVAGMDDLSIVLAEPRPIPHDLDALGRFQDLHLLGKGGLSSVFRAYDPRLSREVALKVIEPGGIGIEDVQGSVMSEARSLAQLEHDAIVQVFEVDESEGFDYIAMEYIAGPSLFDVLEALRSAKRGETVDNASYRAAADALMPIAARCRFVARLARALDFCHQKGVVHRDVKPGNILLDTDHAPKLIDFGLAHSDAQEASFGITQRLIGTAPYAAPEQVEEDRTGASPASDQFSLGTVLYELLTLVNPFHKDSRGATLNAIAKAAPIPPRRLNAEIPYDVERICLHCLERIPTDRYDSIGRLADDLEAFLEYRAISVQPPSPLKQFRLWLARHRKQVLPAAVTLVLVFTLLFAVWARAGINGRNALGEAVAQRVESLDERTLPTQFDELFRSIDKDLEAARAYDASVLSGVLFDRMVPRVENLADRASLRLNELLVPAFDRIDQRVFVHGQRTDRFTTAFARWASCLAGEALTCDDSPHNSRFHNRGIVRIPDGARLARIVGPPPLPNVQPVAVGDEPLLTGIYRCTTGAGENLREVDFFFCEYEPERIVRPLPLAPEVANKMVAVEATSTTMLGSPVKVAAFRITPQVETWGDVRRRLAGTKYTEGDATLKRTAERIKDVGWRVPRDDEPAFVRYSEALGYAALLGARLPTPQELRYAHAVGAVELAPNNPAPVPEALITFTRAAGFAALTGTRMPAPEELRLERAVRAVDAKLGQLSISRSEWVTTVTALLSRNAALEYTALESPEKQSSGLQEFAEVDIKNRRVSFRLAISAE